VRIIRKSVADVPLLEIHEDVDTASADAFERAVKECLEGQRILLLDLSRCLYLDSGGLAVILWTTRTLRSKGWLGIVGCSTKVLRLFEVVGLTTNPGLRLFDDLAAAEESLAAELA
jgi:anti-anti-sigma factor